MPYRHIMVRCPTCSGALREPGQPACEKCGGLGEIETTYHYRGKAEMLPEDQATIDEMMQKLYERFSARKASNEETTPLEKE
jgi:hypothetical protein